MNIDFFKAVIHNWGLLTPRGALLQLPLSACEDWKQAELIWAYLSTYQVLALHCWAAEVPIDSKQ